MRKKKYRDNLEHSNKNKKLKGRANTNVKIEKAAFSNRVDVYHQIFENGSINDSIDYDSLLIPEIDLKVKEAKLDNHTKKMISNLIK